jgi:hypothetical protein
LPDLDNPKGQRAFKQEQVIDVGPMDPRSAEEPEEYAELELVRNFVKTLGLNEVALGHQTIL